MVRWVVGSILHGGPIELYGKSVRSWCDGSSDRSFMGDPLSSVVRAFTHGAMGHRIDPSWGGPMSSVVRVFAHGVMGRRIDPSWGTH